MSIMKNLTGSTTWCDNDDCYDDYSPDKGYDYFLIFILFLIIWWYVLNI
jgi:hypothetical protein